MLKNAYLLEKIGADTAENERNLPKFCQQRNGLGGLRLGELAPERVLEEDREPLGRRRSLKIGKIGNFFAKFANFWWAQKNQQYNLI